MTYVRVATEGNLDYAIAERLLQDAGLIAVRAAPAQGREPLLRKLAGFSNAAQREPWLVLFDLDRDECAPTLLRTWIADPSDGLIIRVAVREIEAWLLADSSLARHLRVPAKALPDNPEDVIAPKRLLVDIVRTHCRTRSIRKSILPSVRPSAVGNAYSDFLIDFVESDWDPAQAAGRSDSLRRAMEAVGRLAGG